MCIGTAITICTCTYLFDYLLLPVNIYCVLVCKHFYYDVIYICVYTGTRDS